VDTGETLDGGCKRCGRWRQRGGVEKSGVDCVIHGTTDSIHNVINVGRRYAVGVGARCSKGTPARSECAGVSERTCRASWATVVTWVEESRAFIFRRSIVGGSVVVHPGMEAGFIKAGSATTVIDGGERS